MVVVVVAMMEDGDPPESAVWASTIPGSGTDHPRIGHPHIIRGKCRRKARKGGGSDETQEGMPPSKSGPPPEKPKLEKKKKKKKKKRKKQNLMEASVLRNYPELPDLESFLFWKN